MADKAEVDDFKIDFNKHSKELAGAIESDARYSRENDAKFRAVHQKVASYDEFRDIVKAAHLKPLERKDKINQRFNQPWNVCYNKKSSDDGVQIATETPSPQVGIPKTSLELSRDWKRLTQPDQKFAYITQIPKEHFKQLFQNDTGFNLMGEILVLLNEREISDADWTMELMEIFSGGDRFGLALQFLSQRESNAGKTLLERLNAGASGANLERSQKLIQKYNLNS